MPSFILTKFRSLSLSLTHTHTLSVSTLSFFFYSFKFNTITQDHLFDLVAARGQQQEENSKEMETKLETTGGDTAANSVPVTVARGLDDDGLASLMEMEDRAQKEKNAKEQ